MKKLKIILVDDHKVFRKGLKIVIEDLNTCKVIQECSTGEEFLEIIDNIKVDLVFMDINMPGLNGFETTKKALEKKENLRIIAMSANNDIASINKMLLSGAIGYLEKDVDYDEIHEAIISISEGKNYFSNNVLIKLTKNAGKLIKSKKGKREKEKLSKREFEVLELISKGLSNIQIAEELHLSERTIEKHKENLYLKTNTENALNLVLYAFRYNIVQLDV